MMESNYDAFISDKEYIRGVIRNHSSHKNMQEGVPSRQLFSPMEGVQAEFWKNFQANGGKILRCHNRQERLKYLQMLTKDQQYNYVLNTHPNLSQELDSLQINYVNSIPVNYKVDAVVALSTTLVARNGSIGFTQPVSRFLTMKNLAKDVIVISRLKDIVPDIEDAIVKNRKNAGVAGMEFITPRPVHDRPDNDQRTPLNPRYILLLICDNEQKNA